MRKFILLLCLLAPALQAATSAPPVSFAGETLEGSLLTLPQSVQGGAAVILVAFTRKAGDGLLAAENELWASAGAGTLVQIRSIVALEGAPGFVVGFIRKGLKKQRLEKRWPTVLLLREDRALLEQWAGFIPSAKDDVYALQLGARGEVRRRIHGGAKAVVAALREAGQ